MKRIATEIPEVEVWEPIFHGDPRGFFCETWRQKDWPRYQFIQDNHARSEQGVLRGLHFQMRHPQGKLVRCVRGEIFDVAVDLRKNSKTFGRWTARLLSEHSGWQLWIPPGFAHGYYVMTEMADVVYKVTDIWVPEAEHSLRWDDPSVRIIWPLEIGGPPKLSKKDAVGLKLEECPTYTEGSLAPS